MSLESVVAIETALHAAVALAAPIALAATGETVAERSGVLNLGLEGTMLVGAFAGALGAHATGSPWGGLAAAVGAAVAFSALFAFLLLVLRADDVIAGTAMNLLAAGATAVLWRARFGVTGADLRVPTFSEWAVPGLSKIPFLGPALFHHHAIVYLTVAAVVVAWIFLTRTAAGLRLRAAGESPVAAAAFGISVRRTRLGALLLCGGLAGAAGAALSLADANTFVEGMSAGRGFVAIALVIFGAHHPLGAAAAAFLFGAAMSLQYRLQAAGLRVPPEIFRSLPYVLSLAVLALFAGRRRAPAALGRGL